MLNSTGLTRDRGTRAVGTSTSVFHICLMLSFCARAPITYRGSALTAVLLATSSLLPAHTCSRPAPALVNREPSKDYTELLYRARHAACTSQCSRDGQMLFFNHASNHSLVCSLHQPLFSYLPFPATFLTHVSLDSGNNEKRKRKSNRETYFQDATYRRG